MNVTGTLEVLLARTGSTGIELVISTWLVNVPPLRARMETLRVSPALAARFVIYQEREVG